MRKLYTLIILTFLLMFSLFLNCNKYTYRVVYNKLDYILYLEVKKYFSPDEKQKIFVRQKLAELQEWHRLTGLPRIRDLFIFMKRMALNGNINEKDVRYVYDAFDREFEIIAEKAIPDAAEFLVTVSDRQIENYRQELINHRKEEEKSNRKKDWLERRFESAEGFLSRIYGQFSSEQKGKIREYIKNNPHPEYDRHRYDSMHEEFIALINGEAGKPAIEEFMKNWIGMRNIPDYDAYKKALNDGRKSNIELFLYVEKNIINDKQKAHAITVLDEWIDIIEALHKGDNAADYALGYGTGSQPLL